jgi:hypothetical protein
MKWDNFREPGHRLGLLVFVSVGEKDVSVARGGENCGDRDRSVAALTKQPFQTFSGFSQAI